MTTPDLTTPAVEGLESGAQWLRDNFGMTSQQALEWVSHASESPIMLELLTERCGS